MADINESFYLCQEVEGFFKILQVVGGVKGKENEECTDNLCVNTCVEHWRNAGPEHEARKKLEMFALFAVSDFIVIPAPYL